MSSGESILARAKSTIDTSGFREQSWTGTFAQYLDVVRREPRVTRTAFERIYDMILERGVREYVDNRKKIVHYEFFDDVTHVGEDAIYGLDIPLMKLVNIFKSAAQRYGTERRVILLHGPVGSSKSTIARLIKRGMEEYSRTPEGALYTFEWTIPEKLARVTGGQTTFKCPMHEEPLRLIPPEWRDRALNDLTINNAAGKSSHVHIEGDLDPACRLIFRELLAEYGGDWGQVVKHVKVRRM